MSKKNPRNVYVDENRTGYDVCYADRKKGQRYCAARFDKSVMTRDQVYAWISKRLELRLVEQPSVAMSKHEATLIVNALDASLDTMDDDPETRAETKALSDRIGHQFGLSVDPDQQNPSTA